MYIDRQINTKWRKIICENIVSHYFTWSVLLLISDIMYLYLHHHRYTRVPIQMRVCIEFSIIDIFYKSKFVSFVYISILKTLQFSMNYWCDSAYTCVFLAMKSTNSIHTYIAFKHFFNILLTNFTCSSALCDFVYTLLFFLKKSLDAVSNIM